MNLLPYYFFRQNTPVQHIFVSFFGDISAKIEKNLPIFCNFFSLCINDLRKSYKNNWSKHLTISENVVSLHCV